MSTEKTDPSTANETPSTPETVDTDTLLKTVDIDTLLNIGGDPENKGTEDADPLDLDDLFDNFDDRN